MDISRDIWVNKVTMGLIAKLAWLALPALAGSSVLSPVSIQGIGNDPGGRASTYEKELLSIRNAGEIKLWPRYNKIQDFGSGLSPEKIVAAVNAVHKNVYRKVDFNPQESPSGEYWIDKTEKVTDETIRSLGIKTTPMLRNYLMMEGWTAFHQSTIKVGKGGVDIETGGMSVINASRTLDAMLRNPSKGYSCGFISQGLAAGYKRYATSVFFTGGIGGLVRDLSAGVVTDDHTNVMVKLDDPSNPKALLLSSDIVIDGSFVDPTIKKYIEGKVNWHRSLVGWYPPALEAYLTTNWCNSVYSPPKSATDSANPRYPMAYSELTSEGFKNLKLQSGTPLRRLVDTFEAYDRMMLDTARQNARRASGGQNN